MGKPRKIYYRNLRWPWFCVVDGDSLQQGDLLTNLRFIPSQPAREGNSSARDAVLAEKTQDIDGLKGDFIVITQTCDLEPNCRVNNVVICPVKPLAEAASEERRIRENIHNLKNCNLIGYYYLNRCDFRELERPESIVLFYDIFMLPLGYLRNFATGLKQRLRLLPPFREGLAFNFARCYGRVGLP